MRSTYVIAAVSIAFALGAFAQNSIAPSDSATSRATFSDVETWKASLDDPNRDTWQMPDAIVDSLRIKPCERVAEIGAGTGYFNARFARAVGPCGRTFATEITPELVEYMRNRAELESTPEVVSLLCSPEDSCLPDSLDLVFLCNTYRYIDRRRSYFARVRDHLVDSGRVAVVDFRETARDTTGWRLPSGRVIEEMQAAGFEVAERFDFLPKQYFLVFSKSRDLVE